MCGQKRSTRRKRTRNLPTTPHPAELVAASSMDFRGCSISPDHDGRRPGRQSGRQPSHGEAQLIHGRGPQPRAARQCRAGEIGRASCREKSVDLGGRRIIKKKKKKKKRKR